MSFSPTVTVTVCSVSVVVAMYVPFLTRAPLRGHLRKNEEPGAAYWREPELQDQRAVRLEVRALEVAQEPSAPADQRQQPTAAVMVMLVHPQVLGELVDAEGQ